MHGLNYPQASLPAHVLCLAWNTHVQCLSRRVARAAEEPVFRQFSPARHLLFVEPLAGSAPPDLRRTYMAFVHRHFLHPGLSGATDAQRHPIPMGVPSFWRVYCGLRIYALDGSDRVVETGVLAVWQRQGRDSTTGTAQQRGRT